METLFPDNVESVTVRVPKSLTMPPPNTKPFPSKGVALFPDNVESVTVTLPPSLSMPPPSRELPSSMVSPEIVTGITADDVKDFEEVRPRSRHRRRVRTH